MLSTAALLVVLNAASWAPGGASRPEDLEVSLVTFGPGADIASLWGHTAVVVVDRRLSLGRLYNFGVVEFDDGFLARFLAGRPLFQVDEAPVMATYALYKEVDRDVRVQELALSPEQALAAANALAVHVRPENNKYLYHHYNDNCSTRPRDIIDRALGGALSRATSGPARMSLRDHTRRYSQVYAPVSVWLDYMQNDELDRPITVRDEAFLPDELERQLDELVIDGVPVVKKKTVIHRSKTIPPTPAESPRWNLTLGIASALLGALVVLLGRRLDKRGARIALGAFIAFEGLLYGLCGIFLMLLGTLTNNMVTHHNENLWLVNPLAIALLPLGIMLMRNSRRARSGLKWVSIAIAGLGVVGLLLKVLPMFHQANGNIVALVLPLSLATAFAFFRPR